MIRRAANTEILLLYRFPVEVCALTPPAIAKLAPYITRYADTLNVRVYACGGIADHCHVLADLPTDMTADRFPRDILPPTARFLRDVVGIAGFAWDAGTVAVQSVSPAERDAVSAYLSEQEARHESGDLRAEYEAGTGATTTETA
ncbi:MAG: hypothetical protein H7Y38_19810, partial [Armatimonadetes bacterium]|nr:hypothetical protein [Armatimonadota bacterium]